MSGPEGPRRGWTWYQTNNAEFHKTTELTPDYYEAHERKNLMMHLWDCENNQGSERSDARTWNKLQTRTSASCLHILEKINHTVFHTVICKSNINKVHQWLQWHNICNFCAFGRSHDWALQINSQGKVKNEEELCKIYKMHTQYEITDTNKNYTVKWSHIYTHGTVFYIFWPVSWSETALKAFKKMYNWILPFEPTLTPHLLTPISRTSSCFPA